MRLYKVHFPGKYHPLLTFYFHEIYKNRSTLYYLSPPSNWVRIRGFTQLIPTWLAAKIEWCTLLFFDKCLSVFLNRNKKCLSSNYNSKTFQINNLETSDIGTIYTTNSILVIIPIHSSTNNILYYQFSL